MTQVLNLQRRIRTGATLLTLMLVTACTAAPQPEAVVIGGSEEVRTTFDQPHEWEFYRDTAQGIFFGIEDGAYWARLEQGGIAWTLNGTPHTDVLIEVNTLQYSTERDNGYGVVCRGSASNTGDGYYFLISGDGAYTIRRGATGTIDPLIAWTTHSAIGQDANPNQMRVACVGDYLALWVNGEFIADIHDNRYSSGFAGITAVAPLGTPVEVRFDNYVIRAASLAP